MKESEMSSISSWRRALCSRTQKRFAWLSPSLVRKEQVTGLRMKTKKTWVTLRMRLKKMR